MDRKATFRFTVVSLTSQPGKAIAQDYEVPWAWKGTAAPAAAKFWFEMEAVLSTVITYPMHMVRAVTLNEVIE